MGCKYAKVGISHFEYSVFYGETLNDVKLKAKSFADKFECEIISTRTRPTKIKLSLKNFWLNFYIRF